MRVSREENEERYHLLEKVSVEIPTFLRSANAICQDRSSRARLHVVVWVAGTQHLLSTATVMMLLYWSAEVYTRLHV